uniref:Ubiquitin-like domain-containing protein n=1 Tax=Oryzias melastigma TaxID=30732 RepID=A0A3B3DJM6_ORYME
MEKKYRVEVNSYEGVRMIIYLCDTEEEMQKITVLQLKEKIDQQLPQFDGVKCENLRLIFADKFLDEDSRLLSVYGIQNMSVIHTVMRLDGGGSPEAYEEYLKKHGKGDKNIDKKHMSMERLAYFKEDDLTHKEQKSVLSVKPPK